VSVIGKEASPDRVVDSKSVSKTMFITYHDLAIPMRALQGPGAGAYLLVRKGLAQQLLQRLGIPQSQKKPYNGQFYYGGVPEINTGGSLRPC
jgi:hypothetical protein